MFKHILIVVAACMLMVSAGWGQTVPFDQCGTLLYVPMSGDCWKLYADDLVGYEIYGNLDGFADGDRVRVIGTFTPAYSTCMIGVCCVVADTTMECAGCCQNRGSFSNPPGAGQPIDISDVVALVAYLFIGGPGPECVEEANVDGVLGPSGFIDVSDLTYLVAYLFEGGTAPPPCL